MMRRQSGRAAQWGKCFDPNLSNLLLPFVKQYSLSLRSVQCWITWLHTVAYVPHCYSNKLLSLGMWMSTLCRRKTKTVTGLFLTKMFQDWAEMWGNAEWCLRCRRSRRSWWWRSWWGWRDPQAAEECLWRGSQDHGRDGRDGHLDNCTGAEFKSPVSQVQSCHRFVSWDCRKVTLKSYGKDFGNFGFWETDKTKSLPNFLARALINTFKCI